MSKKIDDMTEIQERCDHPEEYMSRLHFDLLDNPYRTCKKCGMEFAGRDMLNYLKDLQKQAKKHV